MADQTRSTGVLSLAVASALLSVFVVRSTPSTVTSGSALQAAPSLPISPFPASVVTSAQQDASIASVEDCPSMLDGDGPDDLECGNALNDVLRNVGVCSGSSKSRYLVAMVPDPIDSRLDNMFDDTVGALLLAIAKERPLAQFWLPWLTDREAIRGTKLGTELLYKPWPDAGITVTARRTRCHARWPGVVAFSPRWPGDRPVVLLLVGEVPTFGVQQTALHRAVRIATNRFTSKDKLQIIGPAFSGTSQKLSELLPDWAHRLEGGTVSVIVISGEATVASNRDFLNKPDAGMSFQATVIPDEKTEQAFFRYLVRENKVAPVYGCMLPVAMLAEAETLYGGFRDQQDAGADDDGGRSSGQPALSSLQGNACQGEFYAKYQITFPSHIADIRTAWEREGGATRAADTSSYGVTIPRAGVRIDIQERREDTKDTIPTFSTLAPAYEERSLTWALGLLQENLVRMIGIRATDSRDLMFLVEALHRAVPDAQLFTFESSALFAHPDYTDATRGMLVVTTYPLLTANQFWSSRLKLDEPQTRFQFSTNSAEGTFNAALYSLGESPLLEYRWPLVPSLKDDFNRGKPPVWLTAVGADGLWPVAALSHNDPSDGGYMVQTDGATFDKTLQLPKLEMTPVITIFFVLVFGTIIIGCAWMIRIVRGRANSERVPTSLALLAPPQFQHLNDRPRRRAAVLVAAAGTLVVLAALTWWLGGIAVAAFVFRYALTDEILGLGSNFEWREAGRVLLRSGCAVAALALTSAALFYILPMIKRNPQAAHYRLPLWPLAAFFVVAGVLLYLRARWMAFAPDAIKVFSYWRAIHPTSLLSPVSPAVALCLALVMLGINILRLTGIDLKLWKWKRVLHVQLETAHVKVSSKRLRTAFRHFSELVESLTAAFRGLFARRTRKPHCARTVKHEETYMEMWAWLFLVFGPVLWIAFFVNSHLGDFWWWLLKLLFAAVVAFCMVGVFHMWKLWRDLASFLDNLSCTPLSAAFRRIRGTAGFLGIRSQVRVPSRKQLLKLKERLSLVRNLLQLPTPPRSDLRAIQKFLRDLYRQPPERRATRRYFEEAEDVVALACANLIAFCIARFRGIWFRVSFSALMFVLAITTYPLQPHRGLLIMSWLLVVGVVGATIVLFVQMNRNEILSLLSGTDPNRVSWNLDFVLKLFTYGGLPLLILVSTQFPEIGRSVLSVLGPFFRGTH